MGKLLSIFFATLFLPLLSNAQISFSNNKPKFGETVSFIYNPSQSPLANLSIIRASAFFFNEKLTFTPPQTIFLKKIGQEWGGEINFNSKGTVGVLMAFRDSTDKTIDTNKDKGYVILVHDSLQNPVKGSYLGLAFNYNFSNTHPLFKFSKDVTNQVVLMEKEFARHPELKKDILLMYLSLLGLSKKEGYEKTIDSELSTKYGDNTDLKTSELMQIYLLYSISKNKKAEKYRKLLIDKEPKGFFAQQERSRQLIEENDAVKKLILFESFEKDFPNSPLLSSSAIFIANIYIDRKDTTKLKQLVRKYEAKLGATFYNSVASRMVEKNLDLNTAEAFSLKSIEAYSTEKKKLPTSNRPYELIFRDTYATILEKQGRLKEALENYKFAVGSTPEEWSSKVNESYVLLALKLGQTNEAKTKGEDFIKAGKSTEKIRTAIKNLYIKTYGKSGVEEYITSLEHEVKAKNKADILSKIISETAPIFELKDLSGKIVSLAELRGKVVILDFWATWCGPCIKSFPGMQKAQEKYKNNPKVKFLFVNTWEQGDDYLPKVKKLIADKKYTDFTVPVDIDSKIVTAYKVEAIPTKFVIDAEGNIRFKRRGSSDDKEEIVEEISLLIDTLLNESKKQ